MRAGSQPRGDAPPAPKPLGLLGSLRKLAATLAAIAQTRLALLANEVQEEGLRLRHLMVLAFAAVFFLALGVLLGTTFLILRLLPEYGLAVIGWFALIYIGAGLAFAIWVYRKSTEKSRLFRASIAEFDKDREQLLK